MCEFCSTTDHELEATKCEMSLQKMKNEKIHDLQVNSYEIQECLKQCRKCKTALYCSKPCQVTHWENKSRSVLNGKSSIRKKISKKKMTGHARPCHRSWTSIPRKLIGMGTRLKRRSACRAKRVRRSIFVMRWKPQKKCTSSSQSRLLLICERMFGMCHRITLQGILKRENWISGPAKLQLYDTRYVGVIRCT